MREALPPTGGTCRLVSSCGTQVALLPPPPGFSNSVSPADRLRRQVAPKVGATFQVSVKLNGGQDVFSVPMQLHYDNSKLALINVDSG